MVLYYLDLKETFPSTDYKELVRVLEFLGLPPCYTRLVFSLYSGATTELLSLTATPHPWRSGGEPSRGTHYLPCFWTLWSNR